MDSLTVSDIRTGLADAMNRVIYKGERIVIRRHGKAVAGLVPISDLELLQTIEDRIDVEDARAALTEARKQGAVSLADVKKQLRT